MEKEYTENPNNFEFFEFEEYVDFFIRFLERLNPAIVVERFTGEAPLAFLIAPKWGRRRSEQIVGIIERRLAELDTWQGRLYQPHDSTIQHPDNQKTQIAIENTDEHLASSTRKTSGNMSHEKSSRHTDEQSAGKAGGLSGNSANVPSGGQTDHLSNNIT